MILIIVLSTILPSAAYASEAIINNEPDTDIASEESPPISEEGNNESENEIPDLSEEEDTLPSIIENATNDTHQSKINNEKVTVTFIDGSSLFKQTSVIVNNLVPYPGTPEAVDGQSNFLGWYTDTEEGNQFDFNTPITNSITLYARFSNSYLIQYKDQTGKIIDSTEVEQGKTIPETTVEVIPPMGEHFSYWYEEGDESETPFSFETSVAHKNLVLVPKFASERTVLFISEGSQVDPAYVHDGDKVSKPSDPIREGWSFSHWSLEKNGATAYNFDSSITDNLVLYAVWVPEETEYTVVFWKEKPNISEDPGTDLSNYEFAWSTVQTAKTGDQISINKSTADALVSGNNQAQKALQYSEYTFSNEKTISGNGHSVVNVYFKRIVYKLIFDLNELDSSTVTSEMMQDGKLFKSTDTEQYKITAKDGQYIGDKWPVNEPTITSTNPSNVAFRGWKTQKDALSNTTYATPVNYFSEYLIPTKAGDRTFTLHADFLSGLEKWISQFYYESLYDTNEQLLGYFFDLERTVITNSSGSFNPEALQTPGYQYLTTEFGEGNSRKVYYIRNKHMLDFNTVGGTFTDDEQTLEKKFEDKVEEPNPPVRDGYNFVGWYLDADYREKMNSETYTMPDSEVTLFAKWESTKNIVRYFDSFGGTELLQQGYGDGEDFVFPSEYVKGETYIEGKGVFNGWFWQVGASTFEFSDTIPITKDIDLYAKWKTTGYQLTYDIGEGSGTNPVDSNTYDMMTQAKLESNENIIAPDGQVFIGWKSNRDSNIYYPYAHMQVKGDTCLTAVYAPAEDVIHISYHPGDYEGKPDTFKQVVLKDSTIKLQEMIFTRPDKILVGWSKTENGSKDYELGEDKFSVSTTDIDLYAVWEDKYVNVTFLPGNNGSLDYKGKDITNAILYNTNWLDAELDTPEPQPDTGFKFAGWSPELPSESEKLTADKTFVAQFVELASARVTVRYLDETSEPIAEDKVLSGTEGEDYDVSGEKYRLESIGDYKLIDETNNSIGIFNDDNILVIYTYQKEIIVNTGQIRVSYVDEDGKKISDDVVKSGKLGETYSTEQKLIEGYTFKEVYGSVSGAFTQDAQLITFVYSKDSTDTEEQLNTDDLNDEDVVAQGDSNTSDNLYSDQSNKISKKGINQVNKKLPSTGEKKTTLIAVIGITLLITSLTLLASKLQKVK